MVPMRSLVSVLLVVLAALATAVAIPTGWVARTVGDTDGYVRFTAPLAQDSSLQASLADVAAAQIQLRSGLPAGTGVREVLTRAFVNVTRSPGYQETWDEMNRRSHDDTLSAPAGSDVVVLDLAPALGFLADQLPSGLNVGTPQHMLVRIDAPGVGRALEGVRWAGVLAPISAAVALLAAAGAVLVARRRGPALLGVGLACAASATLVLVLVRVAATVFGARVEDVTTLSGRLQSELVARTVAGVDRVCLVTAGCALAVAVIGVVTLAVSHRDRRA